MSTIIFGSSFDYKALFKDKAHRFVIITDENVEKQMGRSLLKELLSLDLQAFLISFPAGEKYKNRTTKQRIENQMLKAKCGKHTAILALGGGVVTDMAGFIASTYCRGIPFFSLPTTLLGMVDAAIGGKTGINVPEGKNLLGTFYTPEAILINPEHLLSLPDKEWKNGMAEIIKHALILDAPLFQILEKEQLCWEKRDLHFFRKMIELNCSIKTKIVSEDPLEKGLRQILNFGHTIGHAIEKNMKYQISHGEAVAIGMALEAHLSFKMGYLAQKDLERIEDLLLRYQFRLRLPLEISLEALKSALLLDKKTLFSEPRFIALKQIGRTVCLEGKYCIPLKEEYLHALTLY